MSLQRSFYAQPALLGNSQWTVKSLKSPAIDKSSQHTLASCMCPVIVPVWSPSREPSCPAAEQWLRIQGHGLFSSELRLALGMRSVSWGFVLRLLLPGGKMTRAIVCFPATQPQPSEKTEAFGSGAVLKTEEGFSYKVPAIVPSSQWPELGHMFIPDQSLLGRGDLVLDQAGRSPPPPHGTHGQTRAVRKEEMEWMPSSRTHHIFSFHMFSV